MVNQTSLTPYRTTAGGHPRQLFISILVAGVIFVFLAGAFYNILKAGTAPVMERPHLDLSNLDLYYYFLPHLTFAKQSILGGAFPLWNPYQAGGRPFFATIQSGLLYPVNWIALFLDVPRAMLANQALNISIAMVGTVLYLRYLKLKWAAVLLATVLLGYSSLTMAFNPAVLSSYCWLPVIFWLAHRLLEKPDFRRCATLSASLALCFFGGFPQFFYYHYLMAFMYLAVVMFLSRPLGELRTTFTGFGLMILAFVLAIGLISAQLFPLVELSLQSARDVSQKMYPRGDILTPDFSVVDALKDYFNNRQSLSYYGASFLLIPIAIGSRRHRPIVIASLAVFVYSIVFVLSKQIPALALFGKIPFVDSFRYPYRMMQLAQFMVAILVAVGLSELGGTESPEPSNARGGKLNFQLSVAVIGSICVLSLIYAQSRAGFYVPVISAILVLALLAFKHNPRLIQAGIWFLVLLILVDVVPRRYVRLTVPATSATDISEFLLDSKVMWVRANAGYDRVIISDESIVSRASMFEFYNMSDYEPFALSRWENYVRFMVGSEVFDDRLARNLFFGHLNPYLDKVLQQARLAGMASLRYLVISSLEPAKMAEIDEYASMNKSGWKTRYRKRDNSSHFVVYENRFALPRAYLANNYLITHNEEESLQAIGDNVSRISSLVVLENGAPSFSSAAEIENPGHVRISNHGINEVELRVEAYQPSVVVLTDCYYPGWSAFVDGTRKPIWRANSLFRAVEVEPGNHTVVFKYQPASFYAGIAVSACTLSFVLIAVVVGKNRVYRARFIQKPPVEE